MISKTDQVSVPRFRRMNSEVLSNNYDDDGQFAAIPVTGAMITYFLISPGGADGAGAAPLAAAVSVAALVNTTKVGAGSDQAMRADFARSAERVDGSFIRVGILSDSFNLRGAMAAGVSRGDLPVNIQILRDGPAGGADEGRAMAELVHKVAPAAQISFYSAFNGSADFAAGILALARAGAGVIVDDVTYLNEPFFQDGGIISRAVQTVVAAGVDYFTSAGNQGSNFYEANFAGVRIALPGVSGTYYAQNFGTAAAPRTTQSLTVARGTTATLDLQWDQPFASIGSGTSAANSLGMVLYDSSNRVVASAVRSMVGGDPVQILQFTNRTASTDFRLAIITNGGSTQPGLLKYISFGQGVTINDPNAGIGSGTIVGHAMVDAANVVGAVDYVGTQRFGGSSRVEAFSAAGPGKTLFDASGNRLATPRGGTGVDYVAPDGSATDVFAPFYGTSAAAPNAAAVAALVDQANPGLSPAQVSAILAQSAVSASGAAGATGAGLIQADRAVQLARAASGQGSTAVASGMATGGGGTGLASGYASTQELAASVAGDPGAAGDFIVSLDAGDDFGLPVPQQYAGSMAMSSGSYGTDMAAVDDNLWRIDMTARG
jgi:subtilisin family serine protease